MALPDLGQAGKLQIEQREEAGVALLRVRGDLDLSTAPMLCRAVRPSMPRVAIDLRSVGFCDSTGLVALMGAVREVQAHAGAVAIIVCEGDAVDRTLGLAGVGEFLHVARSLADARRFLAA